MRRILVDHARAKQAHKRGGDQVHVDYNEIVHGEQKQEIDFLAIDKALKKLSEIDERQAKVVELRYFGGLSNEEIAEALNTSMATVKRDWTVARAWLHRELKEEMTQMKDFQ